MKMKMEIDINENETKKKLARVDIITEKTLENIANKIWKNNNNFSTIHK
jgi:hypothetical protein